MTIKMFKMKQKGLYELVMDNGKVYSFYEEIILKYELLLSKKIEDKLLPSLLEENKKYECYYKGLERLNKKAYQVEFGSLRTLFRDFLWLWVQYLRASHLELPSLLGSVWCRFG